MEKKSIIKTGRYLVGGVAGMAALVGPLALADKAYADTDWNPIEGQDVVDVNEYDANTVSGWVSSLITFIMGFAIVIFVLKVALTAIDRMLFQPEQKKGGAQMGSMSGGPGGKGQDEGVLCKIPIIGAYPPNKSWKDIFVTFGIQVAICVGAWFIVGIILGLITSAMGTAEDTVG